MKVYGVGKKLRPFINAQRWVQTTEKLGLTFIFHLKIHPKVHLKVHPRVLPKMDLFSIVRTILIIFFGPKVHPKVQILFCHMNKLVRGL